MKFLTIFSVAALATGIAAEPTRVKRVPTIVERDVATITSVFADVGDLTDSLTSDVKSFSGDFSSIQSDFSKILSTLKSGTSAIQSSSSISTTDALGLQPVVKTLQGKVEDAVNALISKKSQLVSGGYGNAVYQGALAQQKASQALADATTSKVPKSLQGIAAQLSAGIDTALQKGVDAFKGTGGGETTTSTTKEPTTTTEATTKKPTTTTEATTTEATSTTELPTKPPVYTTTSVASSFIPSSIGTVGYTPAPTNPTYSPLPTGAAAVYGVSGVAGAVAIFAAAMGL